MKRTLQKFSNIVSHAMSAIPSLTGRGRVGLLLALVAIMMPIGAWAAAATDITVTIDTGDEVTLKDADSDGSYDIGTADELYAFAAAVNGGNTAINGELTANIVVNQNVLNADGSLNGDGSNFRVWTPVGYYNSETDEAQYAGTFDGNGYTVSGLYFSSEEQNRVGLFGYVYYGTVKNVGVIGSYFKGYRYVGGIAGQYSGSDLTNCFNASTIVAMDYYAGGIVGEYGASDKYLKNCYNLGAVSGKTCVGGIVGNVGNTGAYVEDCYNLGTVKATSSAGGGVIGDPHSTERTANCYYLIGCAEAGGVTQNGMGYSYSGNRTTADTEGCTMGMSSDAFVSGEVAYKLGSAWGQNIDNGNENQGYPVLGGSIVYYGYLNCTEMVYTNDAGASDEKVHNHVDGFCTVCGHIDTEGGVTLRDGALPSFTLAEDTEVASLTYVRTLPNLTWNALYVPFEIPVSELADNYDVAYINDIRSYDTDDNGEIDDMTMEIIRINSGTLHANHPYLIRAKSEAAREMSLTLTNATLCKTEEKSFTCSSMYMDFKVTGSYTSLTADELEGKYAVSTEGAWQHLNPGTTLKPFRLYMEMTARDGSPVKVEEAGLVYSRIRIVVRGEAGGSTGIEAVGAPRTAGNGILYDLSGRRVTTPVKGGIYIRDGKKVVEK